MRLESTIENIRDISPSQIRIPSELKAKIKEAAKNNRQSMNAEIIKRLEKSFENETPADNSNEAVYKRVTEALNAMQELAEALKNKAAPPQ